MRKIRRSSTVAAFIFNLNHDEQFQQNTFVSLVTIHFPRDMDPILFGRYRTVVVKSALPAEFLASRVSSQCSQY